MNDASFLLLVLDERIRNIWHQIIRSAANNADLNFNVSQRTWAAREQGGGRVKNAVGYGW